MNTADKERLVSHLDGGFRELQVRDLQRSDENDVRMGTFIQIAALIDALALAYTFNDQAPKPKGFSDEAARWKRFVEAYFPPEYARVADAYEGFRCLLLHNFSAAATLAFTHGEKWRHLRSEGGRVILDRGEFVGAVSAAFEKFRSDVLADAALGERVLRWLDLYPPLGFWVPQTPRVPVAAVLSARALTGSDYGLSASASASGAQLGVQMEGMQRSPDRPRSQPKAATSIKRKRKNSKRKEH